MNAGPGTAVRVMDIGGTHATAASVDIESRTIHPGRSFREPLDGDGTADEILSALARCASRLRSEPAGPWAVAIPGPFDYEHGIARYEGVGKFDALRDVDLRAALSARLPDATDISFYNDAEAFVLGECWAGVARGHSSVIGITLGTGVGSCFVRDGRVLRHGPGVPPDGRVDLLRYADMPLEETVSRRAIRRAYAQAADAPPTLDVREIAQRARQGDDIAIAIFTEAFRALGMVLGPLLVAFEPTMLMVGGSIAASWDLIAAPLRAGLAEAGPAETVLERARHLSEAPLLGAAYLASVSGRRSSETSVSTGLA